ncbi:MAG: LexA family transcriptional regulator [Cyclobacteriaceae bacterium]
MEKAQVNENIKFLRKKEGYTQETFADVIGIKRSLVGAYEEGRADPRLNNLLKMSEVFGVSVDTMISKNVTELSEDELYAGDNQNLKVLAITMDSEENENIELIPQKASAGYLNGYSDPQYLGTMPKFKLPMLPGNATYRAFEISGDSMLPMLPGTVIIGEYVENPEYIKNGKTYVLISKDEGIVYKRVFNYMKDNGKLFLVSDNKTYSPYEIKGSDVLEIWESKAYISVNFPDQSGDPEMSIDQLTNIVMELKQEITKIKGGA